MMRKGSKIPQNRFTIILVVAIIIFFICGIYISETAYSKTNVKNGVIDLSQWNQEEIISLAGKWDFYWMKFITPDDHKKGIEPDVSVTVPSAWTSYKINGNQLPGKGYSTYSLHVIGAKAGEPLSVRINPFSSAYDLYIDNKLVISMGTVSSREAEYKAKFQVATADFIPETSDFDITIHIANYEYSRGGAWFTPFLGTEKQIHDLDKNIFAYDGILIGMFLILSVYSLFFAALRRSKKMILFFVLCIIAIIRTLVYGGQLIYDIFPDASFDLVIRLGHAVLITFPYVFLITLDLNSLPGISKQVWIAYLIYTIIAISIVILLPLYYLTQLIIYFGFVTLISMLYGIHKEVKDEPTPDNLFLLTGNVLMILCMVRDALFQSNILLFNGQIEYTPTGFLIMLLLWDFAFTYEYELIAKERMQLLVDRDKAIEHANRMELKFLKSQIRPHFVNNTMSTIMSISRTDYSRGRKLMVEFSRYLQNCYEVWGLDDLVPIEKEVAFIQSYLALQQARHGDVLSVEYDIDDVNFSIPPLMLQPLIENSIKHGLNNNYAGVHIKIYIKKKDAFVKVGVKDNAGGMDENKVNCLLNDNDGSTGIGIYNINERLKKIYNTTLQIDNSEDNCTDIYMLIPDGREAIK
ncbi:MAG: hypothetical protein CVU91_11355 [Firmicutes bacterium HGW-Firmicutes-16]|nr:MAG: hypothetical protein CVU91_11355 [Firmicutes bacterium HGW-Firmicutes-16]